MNTAVSIFETFRLVRQTNKLYLYKLGKKSYNRFKK